MGAPIIHRTKGNKKQRMLDALNNPAMVIRELNNRSFYHFFVYFWSELSSEELVDNWHIEYLCNELQTVAERVGKNQKKLHDLIINIPPGSSKTSIVMKAFPVWCWTRWYYMRFITASYSNLLSLESGEASRDLIRSDKFKGIYPDLMIKPDKDVKSNYKVVKLEKVNKGYMPRMLIGGNRLSTSVGGSMTGFHGHILIVDDPLNPFESISEKILTSTNRWIDQTLSTRKVDKEVSVTIVIMQRLHQNDPTGHLLKKGKTNIKHICIPAEIINYEHAVRPVELKNNYVNGLFDPNRLSATSLKEAEIDLGQYGYAGQMGQDPTPPKGGMFKVDQFQIIEVMPAAPEVAKVLRYWDKAGTSGGGAYTVGVKIAKLHNGKTLVIDVKRGQWSSEVREAMIKKVAEADGISCRIYIEQEPGSGGKESAENTIRNLSGYYCAADLPRGDKALRADPLSAQVNVGNVLLLRGMWNLAYIEEFRFFPLGTYKDQVDASAAGFNILNGKKQAKSI